uniref:MSHA biogenesis protein MshD n=1 Tax=Cellvibrio fontiphilus TaxID=1815559 RepID=UPI002B4BF9BC|nr:MSHA biogenesis protein MshD [Cellvibrio fontiphilus]
MPTPTKLFQRGVSLIELIVFIVVVSIALLALVGVYRNATINNADPLIRTRALEAAQSLLDEIIALKYDESTPTGGIPACSTAGAANCTNAPENNMNDVDDYHNFSDLPYPAFPGYERSVQVTTANNIKRITVRVTTPTNETFLLTAERANF